MSLLEITLSNRTLLVLGAMTFIAVVALIVFLSVRGDFKKRISK